MTQHLMNSTRFGNMQLSSSESIKPANQERAHVLSAWNRTVPLTKYLDEGIGLNTIH